MKFTIVGAGAIGGVIGAYLEPGRINYGGAGSLYIGEIDGSVSKRVKTIVNNLAVWGPAKPPIIFLATCGVSLTPVIERGERYGIDMTLTKAVLAMIREIEDGKCTMSLANIEVLHKLHAQKR